jgi:hypothetical protein
LSGHRKRASKRGALTNWRQQREEFVRERKKSHRERGTHFLKTAEGGTRQDIERKLSSEELEEHSLTGYARKRNLSRHGKKAIGEPGALTV